MKLCKNGDLDGLIQLEKEYGIDKIINHPSKNGLTPFITATIYGHLNIVKHLVEIGYQFNASHTNLEVLYSVVFNQCNLNKDSLIEVLTYLINELGFDINERDILGNTLLHYAILKNKAETANMLLDIGINKYCQNQYSECAFDLAPNDEILEQIYHKHIVEYIEYMDTI